MNEHLSEVLYKNSVIQCQYGIKRTIYEALRLIIKDQDDDGYVNALELVDKMKNLDEKLCQEVEIYLKEKAELINNGET